MSNFYTTVDLSIQANSDDNWQFVYASQLYQTFFAVYAQFDTELINSTTITLKDVHFKIVNYRGSANLGFINPDNHYNEKFEHLKNGYNPLTENNQLYIGLTCLISNSKGGNDYSIADLNLELKKGSEIVLNRMLFPFGEIGDVEAWQSEFNRKWHEHVSGYPVIDHFFDSEFYDRNGLEIMLRGEQSGRYWGGHTLFAPSARCHTGNLRIIF